MAIKIFAVGSPIPTAADLNTYLIQQSHKIKAADESRITTTLTNDSELVLPVQANTKYWAQCLLIYSGVAAADMSFKWSVPTGSTFQWISDAMGTATTTFFGSISRTVQTASSNPGFGCATAAAFLIAPCKGFLTVGSTSGNLRAQWAQSVLDAGNPTWMRAGSMISLKRIV